MIVPYEHVLAYRIASNRKIYQLVKSIKFDIKSTYFLKVIFLQVCFFVWTRKIAFDHHNRRHKQTLFGMFEQSVEQYYINAGFVKSSWLFLFNWWTPWNYLWREWKFCQSQVFFLLQYDKLLKVAWDSTPLTIYCYMSLDRPPCLTHVFLA